MHALGHADLKTTMSYYQVVPDHLRALVTDDMSPSQREAAASG
jgi:site-specific recombinase XerD